MLFCTLVSEQLELYRSYLASKEVGEILEGSRRALCGIDILRKVCNHPDLLERLSAQDAEDYGERRRWFAFVRVCCWLRKGACNAAHGPRVQCVCVCTLLRD